MVYAPIRRASGIPIIITLITDDGGSEQLRQEVLLEMDKVEKQLGLQISINVTEVDRFGLSLVHWSHNVS